MLAIAFLQKITKASTLFELSLLEAFFGFMVLGLFASQKNLQCKLMFCFFGYLLQIVKWKLMGKTAQVLIEIQKAESCDIATYQV